MGAVAEVLDADVAVDRDAAAVVGVQVCARTGTAAVLDHQVAVDHDVTIAVGVEHAIGLGRQRRNQDAALAQDRGRFGVAAAGVNIEPRVAAVAEFGAAASANTAIWDPAGDAAVFVGERAGRLEAGARRADRDCVAGLGIREAHGTAANVQVRAGAGDGDVAKRRLVRRRVATAAGTQVSVCVTADVGSGVVRVVGPVRVVAG